MAMFDSLAVLFYWVCISNCWYPKSTGRFVSCFWPKSAKKTIVNEWKTPCLPPSVFPHFDPKLLQKISLTQEHLWNHWNQMKHTISVNCPNKGRKEQQCFWFRNWMFIVVMWMLSSAMVTSTFNQPRNWQTKTKEEAQVPRQSKHLCHCVLLWLQSCRCCGRCLSSLWVWFLLSHSLNLPSVYWQEFKFAIVTCLAC